MREPDFGVRELVTAFARGGLTPLSTSLRNRSSDESKPNTGPAGPSAVAVLR